MNKNMIEAMEGNCEFVGEVSGIAVNSPAQISIAECRGTAVGMVSIDREELARLREDSAELARLKDPVAWEYQKAALAEHSNWIRNRTTDQAVEYLWKKGWRIAPEPIPEGFALVPVESAAADVLAERKRQIEAEGWTPEHDDKLNGCELAAAAACYAVGSIDTYTRGVQAWPWHVGWWKPDGGYRRMLIKSGALLLAEIERLDRAVIARSAERR